MTHTPKGLFATFLFLPHFDLSDLSLNRHTATWIIIFPCYFSVKVNWALTSPFPMTRFIIARSHAPEVHILRFHVD